MKKLQVKVNTNSSQVSVSKMADGTVKVNLTAEPKDGEANKQLKKVLADYFSTNSSKVLIKRGKTSSRKTVIVK